MNDINEACATYLKSLPQAERIMKGLLRRYVGMNDVAGNFVLKAPKEAERVFLRGLFKKDFSENRQISISLKRFEQAFRGTPFEGIALDRVLGSYFGKPVETNQVVREKAHIAKRTYFKNLMEMLDERTGKSSVGDSGPKVGAWLTHMLDNPGTGMGKWLTGLYKADEEILKTLVLNLERLITTLEVTSDTWARPVLAAHITKDPHDLDEGRLLYKALLYYLSFSEGMHYPENAQERALLLEGNGIIVDGVHMTVPTYGLKAFEKNSTTSLGWEVFHQRREAFIATGQNLNSAGSIKTCMKGPAYAFENPAVFHTCIQRWPNITAICTSGQVNQSVLKLLSLLEKNDVPVYYLGDYDPEGLMIADRLCKRYDNVTPGIYDAEIYMKIMSDNEISMRRLKQLENIDHPELRLVADAVSKSQRAGYQEYMIDEILEFIRETENKFRNEFRNVPGTIRNMKG